MRKYNHKKVQNLIKGIGKSALTPHHPQQIIHQKIKTNKNKCQYHGSSKNRVKN